MSAHRRSASSRASLELGSAESGALFFNLTYRIEIVSIYFDYVIFRVVYPERTSLFGFRYNGKFVYRTFQASKLRLDLASYRELYRLADTLMRGMFAGVQEAVRKKRRKFHYLPTSERFRILWFRKTRFTVEVEGSDYEFRYGRIPGTEDRAMYLMGSTDRLTETMTHFLFGFAKLVMDAYQPYVRKEGELLDPLTLMTDHEASVPRKKRSMRTRKKLEALASMGKPAESVPKKRLSAPNSGYLFETKTLPD